MPPRRSAATEVVEEEPQLKLLHFNEPLSWRAGKAIATAELLRRLEKLAAELREMEQGEVDKGSLTKVAKELVGQNLIGHKDKGVRAFTACCLADVLKICAPDAPFTATQLRDIFTLFIQTILPALSDPSDAYNTQHMYVLTSLADVKSIVLVTDIPDSENLLHNLFACFFDIISGSSKASTGEQVSKNVEYHMNEILITLVDEAQSLPPGVIDIIVAQFLRASLGIKKGSQTTEAVMDEKQSTLLIKELPAAYRMAEFICNTCSEKMARYISQYFNDVIMDASEATSKPAKQSDHRRASTNIDSDDEDGQLGPTTDDLKELQKAHMLLRELWRASPSVLQNVIPQLEAELSAENIQLRLLATETLGDIVSGIGAAGPPPTPVMDPAAYPPLMLANYQESPVSTSILTTPMSPQSFAQAHPSVYQSFIGRKNDKSPVIRSAWVTAVGRILTTSAGGIGIGREEEAILVNGLAEKLNDADERVRLSAIKAVGKFSFKDIITKLGTSGDVDKSGSVLCSLADRARDRKHNVRVEGMTTISKIWGVAAGEILAGNEAVISLLGSIPSKILVAFYANDQDVNLLLDHVMFEQLIPLSYPPPKGKAAKQANGDAQPSQVNGDGRFDADKIRTDRILVMIKSLDQKSKKAFFALQSRQNRFREVLASFLKRCEEYNGGVVEENAKEVKAKLDQVIQWFASLLPDKPRVAADLWKFAKIHDRRSYQLIRFTIAPESDFKTVFKAIKEFSKRIEAAPGAPAGILETLIPLIYRGGSLVYNRSHLPTILEYSRDDAHVLSPTAHEVLNEISLKNPDIFKAQVKELCKLLQDQAPTKTNANEPGSVETLKACAAYARKYPEEIVRDRKFTQALVSFAEYGEPPKAAKYAVSILMAAAAKKEMLAKDLLQKSTKDWEYGKDHFLTKLAAISQLTLLEPKLFEDSVKDSIFDIATQQILLQVRTPAHADDRNWQDDSDLDEECQAKCWSLKILVNQLRTVSDPDQASADAQPVFKLLNSLVVKEGEISKGEPTPKHHKSRLRLTAAKLLLKLCTNKLFERFLTPAAFNHLATVAQDTTFQVRRGFVEKLQKYLVQNRLSNRFYAIIFLIAFEPDTQFRQNTLTWIRSRARVFQQMNSHVMESTITRLLALLAHHPDTTPVAEDLADTAQYILFYVTSVANEDNLGMIYKYSERVKGVRDVLNPNESDILYVLSDLTQAVLRKWQEKKGWAMQGFPGKLGMPKDLFTPMPTHDAAQQVAEKQYLPEEMDDLLSGLIKSADRKKQKRASDENEGKPSAKKQRIGAITKTPTKEPTVKRPTKQKLPARPAKKARHTTDTPESTAERRRSGRAAGRKSYADRDSSEDEEEMMVGVSKWEYSDGHIEPDKGDVKMHNSDVDETTGEQEPQSSALLDDEHAAEAEDEHTPEPTPRKVNGKTTRKKATPKAKSLTKPKPKPTPPAKATSKSKSKAAPKEKGKAAATKDLYDIDSD